MSLITFHRPGPGRRQAEPTARVAAANRRLGHENAQLRLRLDGAGHLIASLRTQLANQDAQRRIEVAQVAWVLGEQVLELHEERRNHIATRSQLATAIRSNECNANAETVQTDVTALRAAQADVTPAEHRAVPQYAPYKRVVRPAVRVVALWDSPLAAGPASISTVTG